MSWINCCHACVAACSFTSFRLLSLPNVPHHRFLGPHRPLRALARYWPSLRPQFHTYAYVMIYARSTTQRMQPPSCMWFKPSLMLLKVSRCVTYSSTMKSPCMYRSTRPGSCVRPFTPPKAEPCHLRPVTSWNGRVEISSPAFATPVSYTHLTLPTNREV